MGRTAVFDTPGDKAVERALSHPFVPVTREPDGIDIALFKLCEEMRHEARMKEIRQMDIPEDVV